jgi:hypothetical protein
MILALEVDASYWQSLLTLIPLAFGLSFSMSPMTASIMSAVPDRRAGSGSATNDATREVGAALGVAILGSIAASVYRDSLSPTIKTLPAAADERAGSSLAGAVQAATRLSDTDARRLIENAQQAFVDSMHVAALVGGGLAIIAVVAAFRFLPDELPEEGALSGPLHSFEVSVQLLGGMIPATGDDLHRAETAAAKSHADNPEPEALSDDP